MLSQTQIRPELSGTAPAPFSVSDEFLQDLSDTTEIDEHIAAQLAMVLPDICDELLNRRRGDRLALSWQATQDRIAAARATLRASDPIPTRDMRDACETLLRHSTHADERAAAADVLSQMEGTA
ncbi:hypothetical protein ACN2XU_02625 [Primorskyibacter sp. 2E107]|uniref:hypothetical protein n=1 Tax=Primorskyibacter sp. 2E107 TaxID=3403458 RepID=UPI003AF73745